MGGKGQSSFEYMVVIGAALAVLAVFLAFAFFYSYGYNLESSAGVYSNSLDSISTAASQAGSLSVGSSVKFLLSSPGLSFPSSFFCGNSIVFSYGGINLMKVTGSNLSGLLPAVQGDYDAYATLRQKSNKPQIEIGLAYPVAFVSQSFSFHTRYLLYNLSFYNVSYDYAGPAQYKFYLYWYNGTLLNITSGAEAVGTASGNITMPSISGTQLLLAFVSLPVYNIFASTCLSV